MVSYHPCGLLESDLRVTTTAFDPAKTLPATQQLNDSIVEKCKADTKWWDCGAQEYRRRRAAGETPFPAPEYIEKVYKLTVRSTKGGHDIPCRVFGESATFTPRGVLYHIHGGGFVIGSAAGQDVYLEEISRRSQLIIVSVEYRLAPEFTFPAGPEDCYEVAEWLVINARLKWSCGLKYIAGESAGANLSSLVLLHLRNIQASSTIAGIILNYGNYDLSLLPSVRALDKDRPLLLSYEDATQFLNTYLPDKTMEERKCPRISPAYNDLSNLAPALFIVGTQDGLTDDTILMGAKWQLAGNRAVVKFIPGAPHGFMTFDGNKVDVTRQAWEIMIKFIKTTS